MGYNHSSAQEIDRHLPLKPHLFHILLALSEGVRHGSGIMRSILDQTEGKLRLWPATLYGSLEELLARGWIEELTGPDDHPPGESRKKRFFRITHQGSQILVAEASRLQALAHTALARVELGDVTS